MPSKTILIVDDNAFVLKLVSEALEKAGYVTLTAKSGHDAFFIAYNLFPDAVLLDRRLKDMHGDQVLHRIKHNARTKRIPVAFLSSEDKRAQIVKGLSLGADDYIVKPFTNQILAQKVKRLLKTPPKPGGYSESAAFL